MKKRYLLFSFLLTLCSCNQTSEPSMPVAESDSSLQESEVVIDPSKMLAVIEDNNTSFNIVTGNINAPTLQIINKFISDFEVKYGITLSINSDANNEIENEIVVGNIKTRVETSLVSSILTPTAYGVKEADGKIYVAGLTDDTIKEGLNHLLDCLLSFDNKFGIEKNYEFYGDAYMDTFVPKLTNTIGEYENSYYSGDGNYQIAYKNSKYQDFYDYGKLLETQGFTQYSYNEIGENYFATYIKDDAMANISFYYNSLRTHMVYGKKAYLPVEISSDNKLVSPTITHIQRHESAQSSPGLSIVCQLIDGSYIIVDGGPTESKDEQILINFLKDNNPNSNELPKVRWFFTHAHHDHMGLAVSFLNNYHDQIDLELFAYNFPDFNSLPIPSEPANRIEDSKELIAEFEEVRNKYYQDVDVYKFHAGDKLMLPGCQIDVFLTHETFWPQEFSWINHTSSAFKITNGNKSMLVLGDCEQTVCEYLAKLYETNIKCDNLQVTHHGLNGGYIPLYEYVDPSICLWPIDKTRFETSDMCLGTKWGFEYNAWLRNESIRKRTHYHASQTTTIICE